MKFYINAVLIGSVDAGKTKPTRPPDGVQAGSPAHYPVFFDSHMFLMLQTAVGGGWPGEPRDSSVLPAFHRIDYVRYEALPLAA